MIVIISIVAVRISQEGHTLTLDHKNEEGKKKFEKARLLDKIRDWLFIITIILLTITTITTNLSNKMSKNNNNSRS